MILSNNPELTSYLRYDPVQQVSVLVREDSSLDWRLCLETVGKLLGILKQSPVSKEILWECQISHINTVS